MENLPSVKTDNLPAIISGKKLVVLLPERIIELNDRFENVSKIADVADKLMAIEALKDDIKAFYAQRNGLSTEGKVTETVGMGLFGSTIVAGAVGGGWAAAASGWLAVIGAGAACGLVGLLGGLLVAIAAEEVVGGLYARKSGDIKFAEDLSARVSTLEQEVLKTADTRKIALSEHAETIFDKYPDLSAKFARAQAIDKVRVEEAILRRVPSLDKQKPEILSHDK